MEPVYENLRVRYGLTASPARGNAAAQEQANLDDAASVRSDLFNPNIQPSPIAVSEGGSDL